MRSLNYMSTTETAAVIEDAQVHRLTSSGTGFRFAPKIAVGITKTPLSAIHKRHGLTVSIETVYGQL
jgi:hypothetical protein